MHYVPRNLAELSACGFCLAVVASFAYQYLNLLH